MPNNDVQMMALGWHEAAGDASAGRALFFAASRWLHAAVLCLCEARGRRRADSNGLLKESCG